jgi:hypothetical protein
MTTDRTDSVGSLASGWREICDEAINYFPPEFLTPCDLQHPATKARAMIRNRRFVRKTSRPAS